MPARVLIVDEDSSMLEARAAMVEIRLNDVAIDTSCRRARP